MRIYSFAIRNTDGSVREHTGRMSLANDADARAFGKAMILDLMRDGQLPYAGAIMDVANGKRPICSIAF
jgi:uncharacterized protein (DUF2147 family)